jgi:hypothetical protein
MLDADDHHDSAQYPDHPQQPHDGIGHAVGDQISMPPLQSHEGIDQHAPLPMPMPLHAPHPHLSHHDHEHGGHDGDEEHGDHDDERGDEEEEQ